MRPVFACLILLGLLSGCARPLTPGETAFIATVQGPTLDTRRIRIADGAVGGTLVRTRPARPAIACRERVRRPETGTVRISTAGMVLFNRMFAAHRIYMEDYLTGYPDSLPLARAMFIAHEMTHVWQWQNRAVTGYHPLRAAAEHRPGGDPYLFDLSEGRNFLEFGFEQQAGIVEEFVCCRALDPDGARTQRLFALLSDHFPGMEQTSRVAPEAVILPWDGADTRNICS